MAADRSSWQGGVLYVTGHVCAGCTKLIGNAGLSRIVIQDDGVDRSYRGAEDNYKFLRALGIGVEILPVPHPDSLPTLFLSGRKALLHSVGWLNVEPGAPPRDDAIEMFLAQPLQDGIRTVKDQSESL